jgi:4'-phosphopantetheinyl transferase
MARVSGRHTVEMRWLARGEIELPAHDDWLSAREREQVATIRFTKRRQEYLTRRWSAKHAVATVLQLDTATGLAAIEVRNHPSGAPWVAIDGTPATIDISLSDRAGWAVCLVGRPDERQPLGVDLELVEPRSERFIDDYLTEREQRWVRTQPAGEPRDAAANLVWSAKEAALKVLQVGLRADTRSVEVTIEAAVDEPDRGGWIALTVTARTGDHFCGWWRRDRHFVLTLAARSPFDPPTRLPGSADLALADPLHSWVDQPLAHPPPAGA